MYKKQKCSDKKCDIHVLFIPTQYLSKYFKRIKIEGCNVKKISEASPEIRKKNAGFGGI